MNDPADRADEHAKRFEDVLAQQLWDARHRCKPIHYLDDWQSLPVQRAERIAGELYAASDCNAKVWKLGAFDESLRESLGLPSPLVAPVLPDGLFRRAEHVRLAGNDFLAPKFEAELAVTFQDGELGILPCVEVMDTRFAGWGLPKSAAIADFGLQGAMVFGLAGRRVSSEERIAVTIRRDGEVVFVGDALASEAIRRTSLVSSSTSECTIATGSINTPIPVAPGRWDFEFGSLGSIAVTVN